MPKCKDNAQADPGFSVPFSSTVNVSGGGAALQNAVNTALPNTRLRVMDSLAYDALTIAGKTNLTIEAGPGQTPSITAPAVEGGACAVIGSGNSGLAIRGFSFIGSGNVHSGGQELDGLVRGSPLTGMATLDRLIVEDCVFSEPAATAALGVPGIQLVGVGGLHTNVLVKRCRFFNNAAGPNTTPRGYGACTVAGFTNVFIQNCAVSRQDAVVARSASHMRGFTWKSANVVVENCLADDLGTAGSNEGFKHHEESAFGSVIGNSLVRNCVVHNGHRGYRITLTGAIMTVMNSVFHNDVSGVLAGQVAVRQTAGVMVFRDSVMAGAGDGTAFEASVTEDHNDVFNFGATGKVLDPTDLNVDPLFQDVPNRVWTATAPALQTAASDGGAMGVRYTKNGEEIIWCGA